MAPERPLLWVALGILPLGVTSALARSGSSSPCRHPAMGESRRISLRDIRRAQEDLKRHLAWAAGEISRLSPDSPFESGLPSCASRSQRRVPVVTSSPMVGRTIVFAPEGRGIPGDVRVATSARHLREVTADALADRTLIRRFGVRCTPTVAVVRSTEEVELVEFP